MAGINTLLSLIPLYYLLCTCPMWFGHATNINPVSARIKTLDMNLSIHWGPPENTLENETILYTVHREPVDTLIPVDGCIRITKTSCSLNHLYPAGRGFYYTEWFYVEAMSESRPSLKGEVLARFNRAHITVSAPVVYNYTIDSRFIKVNIHGPETPFTRNGKPIYMGDSNLGGRMLLNDVKYNATLYMVFATGIDESTSRPTPLRVLKNGLGKLMYEELRPFTDYVLKIQGYMNYFSDDVTSLEFKTDKEAPDIAPTISSIDVVNRYCDYRDVTITWKDSPDYERNGPVTDYIIRYKVSEQEDGDKYITVPSNQKWVELHRLFRWTKFEVSISAGNSHGRSEEHTSYIEEDTRYIETYKPTISGITKLSEREWNLSWTTPEQHGQCILGYRIVTFINGAIEKDFEVDGYETSWTNLEFTKSGGYQIDVSPVFNDSRNTKATSTTMYSARVKTNRLQEWTILTAVAIVLFILVSAVIAMTKKVFCDYSNLPDISQSRSMKIARNIRTDGASLKSPPKKEYFDATRVDAAALKFYPSEGEMSLEDDVFPPKSTSRCFLLSSTSSSTSDGGLETLSTEKRSSARNEYDKEQFPSPSKLKTDDSKNETPLDSPSKASPLKCASPDNSHGYVPHSYNKKHEKLRVTIPPCNRSTTPSSSSDSGISSSTFTGSVSDYTPSSPISELNEIFEWHSDSCDSSPSGVVVFNAAVSPYVTSSLAVAGGRINSSNLTRERELSRYKRLDSRGSSCEGGNQNGYLTMNPVPPPRQFANENKRAEIEDQNLLMPSDPYSKMSIKDEDEIVTI